jgi:hypothetical protein
MLNNRDPVANIAAHRPPASEAYWRHHKERWTMTEVYCRTCEEFTPLAVEDMQNRRTKRLWQGRSCVPSVTQSL